MGLFFIYSIKVALCLTAFYLFYKLLLSRETFFGFNRAVLLGMMAVSLVLPLVHVSTSGDPSAVGGFVVVENFVVSAVAADAPASAVNAAQVCFAVYVLGVAFFLVREAWSLVALRRLIAGGRVVNVSGGVRTVVVSGDVSPFSWFGNIVINERDYGSCAQDIIKHELAHIAGHHSVDVLLCDLLIIFQWFNPAAWLLKAELQCVHEYEADNAVLASGVDAAEYQMLLIRKAVGDKLFSMANNLNQSSLKKRIAMMLKRKSNPWNRVKTLIAVPVAAVAVAAFATPKAESLSNEIASESNALVSAVMPALEGNRSMAEDTLRGKPDVIKCDGKVEYGNVDAAGKDVKDGDSDVFDTVEQMPEFPGGYNAMAKWLAEQIRYPQNAAKNNVQGRVVVQFVIDKDGTVTNPKVVRPVDAELDAEAVRVVSAMPKWKPGMVDGKAVAVKFTLPVTFRTDTPKADVLLNQANDGKAEGPLVIVDGERSSMDAIKAIDVNKIESIEVLKDEKNTVDKYGAEAAGGVILVKTKK